MDELSAGWRAVGFAWPASCARTPAVTAKQQVVRLVKILFFISVWIRFLLISFHLDFVFACSHRVSYSSRLTLHVRDLEIRLPA